MEEAGSNLRHIAKMTNYLWEMSDYQAMRDAEFAYYQEYCPPLVEDPPASTVVQIVSFSKPSMLVEFDAIALLPDSWNLTSSKTDPSSIASYGGPTAEVSPWDESAFFLKGNVAKGLFIAPTKSEAYAVSEADDFDLKE